MKVAESFEHISPQRRNLVVLGDKARIRCIHEDCWINYPVVSSVRGVARALYEMPYKTQAECLLISGQAGMGKTSLCEKIQSDLETLRKRNKEHPSFITFSVASNPTLISLEDTISNAFGVPIGKIRNGVIPEALCRLARLRNMRFILIDELHNLLYASRMDQRRNLAFLRALSSPPMSLSIIGFGTDDAVHAINSDAQLIRRFQLYDLPRWKENETFRSFLAGYESALPLRRPSELWRREKVKFLLIASEGVTGQIVRRITWGAIWAIIDGKEAIDLECLNKAAAMPPYLERFDDEE